MITVEQAVAETVETINSVSLSQVSEAGRQWLAEWYGGTAWTGENRVDILAGDDGAAELSGLLGLLKKGAGPVLNGLCALSEHLESGSGDQVGPVELRILAQYIAEKKAGLGAVTRLCDAVARATE